MKYNNLNIICKTTNKCNANCTYCFDKITHGKFNSVISYDILIEAFTKFCKWTENLDWTWHGGEPLLMDIKLFDKVMNKFYQIAEREQTNISFSMQSNGILLNEEWEQILDKYNISFGLSYDGYTNKRSRGYELNKLSYLDANGIILIINKSNVDLLWENYYQFNRDNKNVNFNFNFSVDNKSFLGDNIYAIKRFRDFILKYIDDKDAVECGGERTANELIKLALGYMPNVCNYDNCFKSNILSLNTNGDIYKCDETEHEELKIINISQCNNIDDIFKNEKYLKLQNKWLNINNNKKCNVCEYNNIICNRGCLARSLVETNLTVPYSLHCLLLKELIPVVFEKLSDLSPEEFVNLNPNVKNLLIQNHYIPISILEKAKETINVLY